MDVYVNGQPDLVSVDPGSGLQETLHQLRDWVVKEGLVVVTLRLDGVAVTVDLPAGRRQENVDAYRKLELQVAPPRDMAVGVLDNLRQMLPRLSSAMQESAGAFSRGKPEAALRRFPEIMEGWELVLGAVTQVATLCKLSPQAVAKVVPAEAQQDLEDAVRQAKRAMEDADFVALGDVLEYELAPMTNRWERILGEYGALVRATAPKRKDEEEEGAPAGDEEELEDEDLDDADFDEEEEEEDEDLDDDFDDDFDDEDDEEPDEDFP